jgi:hypothetical protein
MSLLGPARQVDLPGYHPADREGRRRRRRGGIVHMHTGLRCEQEQAPAAAGQHTWTA